MIWGWGCEWEGSDPKLVHGSLWSGSDVSVLNAKIVARVVQLC